MSHEALNIDSQVPPLWKLFAIFFKIGCISWGGYMALVSVVRGEIVDKHQFMTDDEIMDGVAVAMMLPGPVAVNVVAYVGNRMAGALGALVCATAVILPSFALMIAFAAAFIALEEQAIAEKVVAAIVPAIAAIILSAAWKMGKKALGSPLDWAVAVAAAGLVVLVGGIWLVFSVIVGAGLIGILRYRLSPDYSPDAQSGPQKHQFGLGSWLTTGFLTACLGLFLYLPKVDVTSLTVKLFSIFSGMSLLLFGGGYIFIPMVQEAVVNAQGWLTAEEFSASIALGQVTPGPILISATFVGYKVAGFVGALVATVAIFMPPACLIVLVSNQLERINQFSFYKAAQSCIRAAVVGMIVASGIVLLRNVDLGGSAMTALPPLGIFVASMIALIGLNKSEVWVIVIAGVAGAVLI